MQSTGLARGIAAFHVWKFSQPLRRADEVIVNTLSSTLPRELYDVVTMTKDVLHMTAKRFEIIGIRESWSVAASATLVLAEFTFEVQQTPNAAALTFFTIGSSQLGGTHGVAP